MTDRPKGWVMQVFEAMAPLVEQLKAHEGHADHFGWSTCAPSYSCTPGWVGGYPSGSGGLTLCGCGEVLHSTVEVTGVGSSPYFLRPGGASKSASNPVCDPGPPGVT